MDEIDRLIAEGDKKIPEIEQRFRAGEALKDYLRDHADMIIPPHCDPSVLHSKGACVYCDLPQNDDLRIFRESIGLPYTDQLSDDAALVPGDDRTRAGAERWGGNRAKGRMDD